MEKITEDTIRQSIVATLIETFNAMMSMELKAVDENMEDDFDGSRVVGTIHFGGEVVGTMTLHLSDTFAKAVTSAMLGIEPHEIKGEEKIKDGIGELATIIAGNLKTEFLDSDLTCVISAPSITSGSDFRIHPADIASPLKLAFRYNDEIVLVELCVLEKIGATEDIVSDQSSDVVMEKIARVEIKNTIVNSVIDVFFTMLDIKVKATEDVPDTFAEKMRTVGSVTFAGEVDGLFNIQINDDFGKQIAAAMLGKDEDEVESEEEVYDVIRELSNIISGNLKSNLVDSGLSCVLSAPAITNGRDFKINPPPIIRPSRFLFSHQDHVIIVEAGVKKDEAEPHQGTDASAMEGPSSQETPPRPPTDSDSEVDPLKNLGLVMDIPLPLTVELGRTKKRINDILKMEPQSVVELEQMEGEAVNVLINQTLIAKGFVVVENEKYGIRISEIMSRKERLKGIQ